MKVKICPLCDSEMTGSHYCRTCHSWIWKPEVLDIHYNAGARGRGEVDCAYGDGHDLYDHQDQYTHYDADDRYQRTASGRPRVSSYASSRTGADRRSRTLTAKDVPGRTVSTSHQEVFGSQPQQKKQKKKSSGCLIWVIVIIVMYLISGLISAAESGRLDRTLQRLFGCSDVCITAEAVRTPEIDNDAIRLTIANYEIGQFLDS